MPVRDQYYSKARGIVVPFEFNQEVANCFDDMLSRSIPYYDEIHKLLADIVSRNIKPGSFIYDLGCSTGNTLFFLSQKLQDIDVEFIGLDESHPMIIKAKEKCAGSSHTMNFICGNLMDHHFRESDLIIMNYTLQFIPKGERVELLQRIYRCLRPGGLLVLAEKIESRDRKVQSLQTELYEDFKRRNGYSELEISQKREALENILSPLTMEDQLEFVQAAGFSHVDMVFRWFNFACFLGIKKESEGR